MFDVSGDASVPSYPGESALDNPSFRQDSKALCLWLAANDFQFPLTSPRDRLAGLWPLIALVSKDDFDEGKSAASATIQDERGTIAILNIRRMDHDPQHQAERIDKDVLLDALCSLARVQAGFLGVTPPFSADLAVLLSMIAAVGDASRPSASRKAR